MIKKIVLAVIIAVLLYIYIDTSFLITPTHGRRIYYHGDGFYILSYNITKEEKIKNGKVFLRCEWRSPVPASLLNNEPQFKPGGSYVAEFFLLDKDGNDLARDRVRCLLDENTQCDMGGSFWIEKEKVSKIKDFGDYSDREMQEW